MFTIQLNRFVFILALLSVLLVFLCLPKGRVPSGIFLSFLPLLLLSYIEESLLMISTEYTLFLPPQI